MILASAFTNAERHQILKTSRAKPIASQICLMQNAGDGSDHNVVRCISAMIRFDPSAPQRMWLEKHGRKPVNTVAALLVIVGILLGTVSSLFGGIFLRVVAVVLFLSGSFFLDGFRRRPTETDKDDDLPGPGALF